MSRRFGKGKRESGFELRLNAVMAGLSTDFWVASHVRACRGCEGCWPVTDEGLQPPATFRDSMELQLADNRKGVVGGLFLIPAGRAAARGSPLSICRPLQRGCHVDAANDACLGFFKIVVRT